MPTFNVYLAFDGTCEEAMNFYKDIFGGDLQLMRMGDSPVELPEEYKRRIMHATLTTDAFALMAADSMPGQPHSAGNNVTLSLNFTDETEQASIFEKLAPGGTVLMPLQDTFWEAKFGMLNDRYGIPWMFNCQKAK